MVGDTVVTPASISSYNINREQIPGWTRGWDVRTGRRKWTFETVPQADSFGNDTWEGDSWRYTGKISGWTIYSADPELGYLYIPLNTAAPDYWGGHRLGDNLFAETLLCLDLETGQRVWHYQFVHHGLWDYDLPAAPNLLDIVVDGRPVKAVAQISKQGFVFAFDRVTGEPIWPIEERPVPASDIPGERASATQPFPTRPAPFEYQGVTVDDLVDFTPEIREMALEVIEPFRIGPLYTPPSLVVEGGNQGTLGRPSAGGGANWGGAAVDPETGMLYVPSNNTFFVFRVREPREHERGTLRYFQDREGAYPTMPRGLPLFKPPYSRMTAIDMNTGEHAWMQPLGNGDRVRNHPLLRDLRPAAAGWRQRKKRSAADEDPAHQRVVGRRHERRSAARGPRQDQRRGDRVGRSAARRHRHADDLPARRPAVHRADGRRQPGPRARRAGAARIACGAGFGVPLCCDENVPDHVEVIREGVQGARQSGEGAHAATLGRAAADGVRGDTGFRADIALHCHAARRPRRRHARGAACDSQRAGLWGFDASGWGVSGRGRPGRSGRRRSARRTRSAGD